LAVLRPKTFSFRDDQVVSRLDHFNAMPSDEAEQAILGCCSSRVFSAAVALARPYDDVVTLLETAEALLASLEESEIDAALAGHPRIGERGGAQSQREQALVATSGSSTLDDLAEANLQYEQKFGYTYLVCASGRTGEELLEVLRSRLMNPPDVERQVMRSELVQINRVRLVRMFEEPQTT